jgi:hypothetical protein
MPALMDKMQAFRLAFAEMGDAPAEALASHIELKYGVRIEPRYIPVFRATVQDLEKLTRIRATAPAAAVAPEGTPLAA